MICYIEVSCTCIDNDLLYRGALSMYDNDLLYRVPCTCIDNDLLNRGALYKYDNDLLYRGIRYCRFDYISILILYRKRDVRQIKSHLAGTRRIKLVGWDVGSSREIIK